MVSFKVNASPAFIYVRKAEVCVLLVLQVSCSGKALQDSAVRRISTAVTYTLSAIGLVLCSYETLLSLLGLSLSTAVVLEHFASLEAPRIAAD